MYNAFICIVRTYVHMYFPKEEFLLLVFVQKIVKITKTNFGNTDSNSDAPLLKLIVQLYKKLPKVPVQIPAIDPNQGSYRMCACSAS